MLIDPHVNPSSLSPTELIDRMIEASLDGAVIACTNSAKDALPYLKALIEDEFVCYVGVELRTEHGDLVFIPEEANDKFFNESWGPNEEQAIYIDEEPYWQFTELETLLSQHEGVVIVCHPYSRLNSKFWGDRAFTLNAMDAVETRIGRGLPQRDFLADQISELKAWARLGTSGGDCQFLGSAATVVKEDVETQETLCASLRNSVCWPIEFEDPMFPRARYQGVVADEGPRWLTSEERERKEALNHLARQRGETVEEIRSHGRPGGRWGRKNDGVSSDRSSKAKGSGRAQKQSSRKSAGSRSYKSNSSQPH